MGVLGNHIASAGFATVHPSNSITIDAVEAYELEKFSPEVRRAAATGMVS